MAQRVEFNEFLERVNSDPQLLSRNLTMDDTYNFGSLLVRAARRELEMIDQYINAVLASIREGQEQPMGREKTVPVNVFFNRGRKERWRVGESVSSRNNGYNFKLSRRLLNLELDGEGLIDEAEDDDECAWDYSTAIFLPKHNFYASQPGPRIYAKTPEIYRGYEGEKHYINSTHQTLVAAIEVFSLL